MPDEINFAVLECIDLDLSRQSDRGDRNGDQKIFVRDQRRLESSNDVAEHHVDAENFSRKTERYPRFERALGEVIDRRYDEIIYKCNRR